MPRRSTATAEKNPEPASFLAISRALAQGRELPPLIIPKASQSRRKYMAKRYGHKFEPGKSGSLYLPAQVRQELAVILRELEKHDELERAYIYPYELLHDALRKI